MRFGEALRALEDGKKVARSGWNGKGLWLELQRPDAHSKMTLPYIFMSYPEDAKTTPGARVPWLASQTDMLADDWSIVGKEMLTLPVIGQGPDSLENEIQAKASTAPRVTPADIKAEIVSEFYFTAADGYRSAPCFDPNGQPADCLPPPAPLELLTFCVLVLKNGFTVTGGSTCVSPESFNAEIGRRIARENAVQEVWTLLGFRLRDELSRPVLTEADALADLNGTPRPEFGAR